MKKFFEGVSSIIPFLPHYLKQKGYSAVDLTTVLGVVPFLVILTKPLIAHLADKTHRHRIILLGTLTTGLIFMSLLVLVPRIENHNVLPQHIKYQSYACAYTIDMCDTLNIVIGANSSKDASCALTCNDIRKFETFANGTNARLKKRDDFCEFEPDFTILNVTDAYCFCHFLSCQLENGSVPPHLHRGEFWLLFFILIVTNAIGLSPSYCRNSKMSTGLCIRSYSNLLFFPN